MDLYKSSDWKRFRDQVVQLDGGICSNCGRGKEENVVLHVHHKTYIRGRKPWEYSFENCIALCAGCHAAEHGKIPPKFGWDWAGWEDLGGLFGICDCCGTQIRYTFFISHPDWYPMEVGTECCDNLTSTKLASSLLESHRRYATRLKRFVSSSRWASLPFDIFSISHKKIEIRIRMADGKYRIWMNGIRGVMDFSDLLSAKVAVFDAVESGAAHRFLRKRGMLR